MSMSTSSRWEAMFGLDYRSLAVARMLYGLLIIGDLTLRAVDLTAHYTDEGVHPREYAFAVSGFYVCLHMMNGEWLFQAALFLIHALFALSFSLGYRTRISAVGLWLLTCSLAARNHFVLYGGYVMMRLLSVWFPFLPMGRVWSIDAALKSDPTQPNASMRRGTWHVSGVSLAFLVQMAVLYMSSAWHKTGKEWREEGSAAWLALNLDYFRWGVGDWLLNHRGLCASLTFFTLHWESYGPFLFFSPIFPQGARLFGAFGFWCMHFGLAVALRLSVFLPTFTVAIIVLLPAFVWDDLLLPLLSSHARLRLRIFYDPASRFATRLAQLCRLVLVVPGVSVQHLSGELKDVHFRVQDAPLTHTQPSQALAAVLARSPLFWPLAPLLRSSLVGWWIDAFAQQQYELEKHRSARPQQKSATTTRVMGMRLLRKVAMLLLGTVMALCVVSWCLGNTGNDEYTTPEFARPLLLWLHLDQTWNLFAPRPPAMNFWYWIPGELANGTVIELWEKQAWFHLTIEPPVNETVYRPREGFADYFLNSRWYKWFENINEGREDILLPFGRWICRRWNEKYKEGQRLYQYRINVVFEWNHLNGTHPRAGTYQLWWHVCFDKETPAPTDENGATVKAKQEGDENEDEDEEIRPLKEELQVEDEGPRVEELRQQQEEKEKQEADAEAHAQEAHADNRDEVTNGDARREKEEREATEKHQKRVGALVQKRATTVATEKPLFRRPIERLKEIEEEDRKEMEKYQQEVEEEKRKAEEREAKRKKEQTQ